jgi:hypothetical protein
LFPRVPKKCIKPDTKKLCPPNKFWLIYFIKSFDVSWGRLIISLSLKHSYVLKYFTLDHSSSSI